MKNLIERFRDRLAEHLQNFIDRIDPAPAADREAGLEAMDKLRRWLYAGIEDDNYRMLRWTFDTPEEVAWLALKRAEREGVHCMDSHEQVRAAREAEHRRQWKLERDVFALLSAAVRGESVTVIAPTQEYARQVYNEAVRRLDELVPTLRQVVNQSNGEEDRGR